MITANQCYIEEQCNKHISGKCSHQEEFCIKLFKLNYLYEESLLSDKQRTFTPLFIDIDGTDKEEFRRLKEIERDIENFVKCGRNLYIHSSTCGNGKTEWSIRMIQSYFNSIWHKCDLNCKALFINVPRFLLALKDSLSTPSEYINHIKKHILEVDVVVWDELGIKNATQFEHENLLNLINTRIDFNKSNIYTSNLTPQELQERLGDRLYSRIVNLSEDIEFHGRDKRSMNK